MGILSRFRTIMASNINARVDQAKEPGKAIEGYMQEMNRDLGQVKAETAAVAAEEQRARRALDDCESEIRKLQTYAERSVQSGEEDAARRFLERKAALTVKLAQHQVTYDAAVRNAAAMKHIEDKLTLDRNQLTERHNQLKERLAATKEQQRLNAEGSPVSGNSGAGGFADLEEKVNNAYNEAMAIAELRAGPADDLEEQLAALDRQSADRDPRTEAEDELAELRLKMDRR